MAIDVHAHHYPTAFLERYSLAPTTFGASGHHSLAQRLELMESAGVTRQVLSLAGAQPYFGQPSVGAGAAAMANDLLAELCDQHQQSFSLFAALPLPHLDEAIAELERVACWSSFAGVVVGSTILGESLAAERFEPLLQALHERSAAVFLHPVGRCEEVRIDPQLQWPLGAPFQDTLVALALMLADVPRRFPGAHFIVPHLGGTLPFVASRLEPTMPELEARLGSLYYDTVTSSQAALRCACSVLGPGRLLFGSDYPYCSAEEMAARVRLPAEAGLDGEEVEQVLAGRAADLLGIGRHDGREG